MSTTQIVISKLTSIESRELFLSLTKAMIEWLNKQPGFLEYSLYENGIDMSDILVYESTEAAKKINEDFRKTAVCRKMIALVDPNYRSFFGNKVRL